MPRLITIRDQVAATNDNIELIDIGTTPTDAIIKCFPDGIDPNSTKIYVNHKLMVLPSESDNPSIELLQPLDENGIVVVALEVKGIEVMIAIALVSAIVAIALIPSIPGNVGTRKDSPNNSLQGQTNIARPYQAYPLIFGSPVSFPDLTGEPNIEYVDNVKIVTQLMNVGVGLFDITAIRAGETPLSNFLNSSSTIYEPVAKNVTVPNVIETFAINEIDGQEIEGADVGIVLTSYDLTKSGVSGNVSYIGTTFIFDVIKDTDSDQLKTDFDAAITAFQYRVNYLIDNNGQAVADFEVSGTGDISTMILDGGGLFYTVTVDVFNGDKSFSGYDFDTPFLAENTTNSVVGPINIGISVEEVWFGVLFDRGLKSTVSLRVLMQQLDGPNGNPIVGPQQGFVFDTTADTLEQQFRTFKGVLFSPGFYSFEIWRTDISTNDANRPDNTKIEAVYAINRKTNVEYGNVTLLETVVPATINATSLRENKINLDLTSKIISYDVDTSSVIYAPSASRKFADALLHLYVDFFGFDSNTLALDELYEIQNRLDLINPALATFDFTFDDIDVSLDERMDAILNVARCYKWLDGDVYRFRRNEARAFEATTITRRDMAQDEDREYSLTYNPQLIENFDSVKIEYVDSMFNKKAYIYRKLDPASLDPNNPDVIDGIGFNPKSIALTGCYEEFNAINRAELEVRTLAYQRDSLSDTMLSSGMFLDKGDMVLYAEQYNSNSDVFDGEITAVSGTIATISESIIFDPLKTYQVHYTIEDGSSLGPFAVTEVANQPFQFNCASLGSVFVRDSVLGFLIQTGSRYIISTVEELDAARWTVIEKEPEGRNVQITMANYDDKMYEFD